MQKNKTARNWSLTINDDGILVLPEDLLKETGWKEGDNLLWIDNKDGTWSLVKEDLTNFVIKGIIKNEQN